MPRIRTIKPEFPQSESIGRLSRDARLLFVQLWTVVDDAGRTRAAPRMLVGALYPYDDDAAALINGWLDELEAKGRIRRYELNGAKYLQIVNWLEHQKIDRPSARVLPAPPDEKHEKADTLASPREPSRALDADLGPRTKEGSVEARASNLRFKIVEAYLEFGCEPVPDTGTADVWEKQGFDPDLILSVIRDGCARKREAKPLAYWFPAIREAHEKRAPAIKPKQPTDWGKLVAAYKKSSLWPMGIGPEPGYAGCRAPAELLAEFGYRASAA